jgi:3-hydroxyacyl-CoA dehydrogenase/enoyl-CoA hydratase/3-hydroxybutyryl-CoA epimerase
MPLVEIIVGKQTSDETLARAFDYVLQIGKTPIVVNDSRGFYTSRVFGTYVMEGITMLGGRAPAQHRGRRAAGRHADAAAGAAGRGEPEPGVHVAEQTRKDLAAEGRAYTEHPGMNCGGPATVRESAASAARPGAASTTTTTTASAVARADGAVPAGGPQPPQQELIDRLMFAQANEAARCLEEGVLRSVADGNIGSIFGWGFAPFHGGALQFIDSMGARAFVERARELAARHGRRFEPAGAWCAARVRARRASWCSAAPA